MNLRDQFQQGTAGVLTKRQSCVYPTFYYYYPYNYQKIFSYMLCAVLPKWEQLPPWGVTIAVALNKRWPFETPGEGCVLLTRWHRVLRLPVGSSPVAPADRTCKGCGQQLLSCVVFLHDVNSLNKRKPLAALKKKKKKIISLHIYVLR